jgi:hypothetical protein
MQVYLIAIKIFKDFRQIVRPAAYETLMYSNVAQQCKYIGYHFIDNATLLLLNNNGDKGPVVSVGSQIVDSPALSRVGLELSNGAVL